MLNILNIGFEHAVHFSIDDHKMWIVANDGGFIKPKLVDVLYITNGARYTVLVKLDQPGDDYTMRLVSTSKYQNLHGYSILRYPIDQQPSRYERHVTEFFLNQKPWQLYHSQMGPLLFVDNVSAVEPPVVGGLPWGTTVDVIVQNTVDEVMPLYKHGDPMFLVGSQPNATWKWDTVEHALAAGVKHLNVRDPPLQLVHDVPPLGWAVLRWQIRVRGATMLHSNKFKYYAMGMSVPLLEGMDSSMRHEVPDHVKHMPHVEFAPKNDGVFG
ncbi:hypothetical protein K4K48_002839 [Colletotrichum sp. SAR 10_66]|nr:hypothetical protein K4K48_002839 [Colletotrichum sp. SAR 10_66]